MTDGKLREAPHWGAAWQHRKGRNSMYKKIIVPIAMDQLEHGESVLGIAVKLIDEGGEIILLNVVEDLNAYAQGYMIVDFPLEMIEESRKHAVKTLEALRTKHGINGRVEIRTGGAAGSINALAKEENADLVIIASHRPGLIDYFIGSTASRVVSHCPCAVLIDR
ncbi:universal stress protein [Sinorhizobium medicae]|uniref:UspA domain protein n=3 Tax=Sinorhizobium medicae TaxID=110321 RepID=A6U729_SINMW|nr:UspA domain protein [Sinorhizobium medicae WSM419]PLT80748.1 universal stress protein [Sinorhizobium medicae]PLU00726.1 universal stress protein [Sinorhizobium medicae]PLU05425.1 universal stress protein [Sinorhizobium medicae]PLU05614.1 universal stress protein [Sinorhizobium medicae]